MSWWDAILKAIQLKARYLCGLWLLGGLILLMPSSLSDRLHLVEVRNVAGGWIGLASVGAFAFWVVQTWPWVCGKHHAYRRAQEVLRNIDTLNDNELFFIRYCLYKMHRTVYLPVGNTAAESLCHKGLMEKAPMGDAIAYPYTILPQVWKNLLSRKSQLLPDPVLGDANVLAAFEECSRRMKRKLY